MRFQDITVLKSISPITLLDIPNKQTVEVLAKITQDQQFQQFVVTMRKTYNQPPEGLNIKLFVGQDFKKLPYLNNEFVQASFQIIANNLKEKIGFDDSFIDQLILLIFFNACIDVEYFEGFISHPITFILGKKSIASTMFEYPHEVGAILIPFNISQNKLVSWIEKNWSTIQKQMDDTLTANPYILRMHKNTEIALEVIELRDQQKKKFSEITLILTEKYPEDERVCSEDWVKKIYHDYKELWNNPTQQPKIK